MLGESKKPLGVRRAELFGSGLGSLAGRLVQLCTDKAEQLLRHPTGSNVLVEVAIGGEGGVSLQQLKGIRLHGVGARHPVHVVCPWREGEGLQSDFCLGLWSAKSMGQISRSALCECQAKLLRHPTGQCAGGGCRWRGGQACPHS